MALSPSPSSSSRHSPLCLVCSIVVPFSFLTNMQFCGKMHCISSCSGSFCLNCWLFLKRFFQVQFIFYRTKHWTKPNWTKPNLTEPNRTVQNRFKLSSGLEDRKQNGIVNRRESNSESDKNQRFVVLFLNGENRKWSKTTPSCKNLLEFFVLLAKQTS